MVYDKLQGDVPVPEVYGWSENGCQVFIYMALIEGDTLEQRWAGMKEDERLSVCAELRRMSKKWRVLQHDQVELCIGTSSASLADYRPRQPGTDDDYR
jgi:predicted Ser/Thr protein kinase